MCILTKKIANVSPHIKQIWVNFTDATHNFIWAKNKLNNLAGIGLTLSVYGEYLRNTGLTSLWWLKVKMAASNNVSIMINPYGSASVAQAANSVITYTKSW